MQETKLANGVYMQESSGFWVTVTATTAPSAHYRGAAVFYREACHLAIEDLGLHSLNIIIFQMVTVRRWCHVVG